MSIAPTDNPFKRFAVTKVYAVEAIGFEKMAQSLAAGRRIDLQPGGHSICDAISGLYTAEIPFAIIRRRAGATFAGTFAVSDDDAKTAMRVAFGEFGVAVEPGGAVALAAVLTRKKPLDGKTIVVTLSGRNVDLSLAARVLGES
jgi:threonine dehydratase